MFRSAVLASGVHSVTVTVQGTHRTASTGNTITVDRALVTG